jgi:trk system potassium uptake protein TrkH
LGITAELNTIGRLIIIAMMVWGRLGAMTIVVALAQHHARAGVVEYPEGELLVG